MSRFSSPPLVNESERRISRLENDLYMARYTIVRLAPDRFHDLLGSYSSCRGKEETYHWPRLVAEKIIEQAVIIPSGEYAAMFGQRAWCPLCRGGSQSAYESGFKLNEGLRRHLVGYGQSHVCPVMEAARAMARETWEARFSIAERAKLVLDQALRKTRLATETVYVTAPTGEALLAEGSVFEHARADDDAPFSMKWAEQRLFSLGFEIVVNGRERSYTKTIAEDGKSLTTFADPRFVGAIHFRVFDSNAKGKTRSLSIRSINIRDTWKNRLVEKVEAGMRGK